MSGCIFLGYPGRLPGQLPGQRPQDPQHLLPSPARVENNTPNLPMAWPSTTAHPRGELVGCYTTDSYSGGKKQYTDGVVLVTRHDYSHILLDKAVLSILGAKEQVLFGHVQMVT